MRPKKKHYEWLNKSFGYFYTVNHTLAAARTAYQKLKLVSTDEFGRVLQLDGITQVAEKNEFQYHETMVHPALCGHGRPKAVLIIGAGDGLIAREVLKYPCVKQVCLAELDGGVVDFSRTRLKELNRGSLHDARVQVCIGDGRAFVRAHRESFDAVIMDLTDPFGPSKMLYTKEFFREVKASFRNDRGVFVMHTESPITRPATFAGLQATLRSVFPAVVPLYLYIQMYATLWSITVASGTASVAAPKAKVIDATLAKYRIRGLRQYNGAVHQAMQVPYPYISALLRRRAHIISDRRPDIPDEIIHS
ncbi:MAG: polyamine aminopropyltransferase [Chitinivibrionales bacterium]|nr:polyamine aminopropyltransferase [Chitinivibrionales bacterium]